MFVHASRAGSRWHCWALSRPLPFVVAADAAAQRSTPGYAYRMPAMLTGGYLLPLLSYYPTMVTVLRLSSRDQHRLGLGRMVGWSGWAGAWRLGHGGFRARFHGGGFHGGGGASRWCGGSTVAGGFTGSRAEGGTDAGTGECRSDGACSTSRRSAAGPTIPELPNHYRGKVRDNYDLEDGPIIIATTAERFDDIKAIPFKGHAEQIGDSGSMKNDICPNHVIEYPDPNVLVCRRPRDHAVEIVVRDYLTGRRDVDLPMYRAGRREIYVSAFPRLREHQKRPRRSSPRTTKPSTASTTKPLTPDESPAGLLTISNGERSRIALGLFARGREIVRNAVMILVDTKYESASTRGPDHSRRRGPTPAAAATCSRQLRAALRRRPAPRASTRIRAPRVSERCDPLSRPDPGDPRDII